MMILLECICQVKEIDHNLEQLINHPQDCIPDKEMVRYSYFITLIKSNVLQNECSIFHFLVLKIAFRYKKNC